MPDPDRLLRTLHKAAEAVRQTPGRHGRFVQLQGATEILVAGDLHGHIGNFQAIIKAADLANNPQRHLVLQEVIHGRLTYPGGGDKSHQLIDLFAALKFQFPWQVHMLLGNHELSQWLNRLVMKEDRDLNALFREGVIEAYGSDKGTEIYDSYLKLFAMVPLALRTANRIFVSHSLPRERHIERFEVKNLETDVSPSEDLAIGGPVYELLWGRDTRPQTCDAFLKKVDCDWLVSGHIALDTGFVFPNMKQLILDCCDRPAAYCLLPADRPISFEDFKNSVHMIEAG